MKKMDISLFTGEKNILPKEYLEQYFTIQQKAYKESYPFSPPEKQYYLLEWNVPELTQIQSIYSYAITDNNLLLAYGRATWNVKYDNLNESYIYIYVLPKYRKKGLGSKILCSLVEKLPEKISKLSFFTIEGTPGELFLRKLIPKQSYEEKFSICDLTKHQIQEVSIKANEQRIKASKEGYKLIFCKNTGFENKVKFNEFIKVVESIWNDMPTENLEIEDEKVTKERFLEIIERGIQKGSTYYHFIAIDKRTKNIAGYTTTSVNKYQPTVASQDDTGVVREHRGHGLGLSLKYQMLELLLKETKARFWFTGNASSNKYMIRINEILGYKNWKSVYAFQIKREELKPKINCSRQIIS
ncbi:MAG: GNAT family N-acetyltransferase [Candidatus Heimdallarchaeaceae archaeon]